MKYSITRLNSVLIFFCLLWLSSCIPTKKVVYLENFDGNESEQYTIPTWKYNVQEGDRFYVKIIDPMQGLSFGDNASSMQESKSQTPNLIQQVPSVHDFQIDEEGMLNLPVIGKVAAVDKTVSELRKAIVKACEGFITNPTVKLYMTNYNVTLLGEFNAPGFYQLIPENPTFFEAVGLGGDLTDFADRKKVKLIRRVEGKVKVYYLDVTDPAFANSPYYYVQPNDVIHVMPLKVKKFSSDNALPLLLSGLTVIVTLANILSR